MEDQEFYGMIIQSTASRMEIHILLIVFEFIISYYPYFSSFFKKIKNYNSTFEHSKFDSVFIFFIESKKKFFASNFTLSFFTIYLFGILTLTFFGIFAFFFYHFYPPKNKRANIFQKFVINFLGIFSFRYFSFLCIDCLECFLFIKYSEVYFLNFLIKLILFLVLVGFCTVQIFFLSQTCFCFRISNKALSQDGIEYPFDYFSEKFDKMSLFFKVMISLETNLLINNNFFVSKIILSLNVLIMIMFFLFFVNIFHGKYLFLGLQGNFILYFTKKFSLLYGVIQILISVIISSDDSYLSLSNTLVGIFLSVCLLIINWNYFEKNKIKDAVKQTDPNIIIYFLLNDSNYNEKKEKKMKKLPFLSELICTWFNVFHRNNCDNEDQTENSKCTYYRVIQSFQKAQIIKNNSENTHLELMIYFLFYSIKQNAFCINKYYSKTVSQKKISEPLKKTIKYIFSQRMNNNLNISNFYILEIIKISDFTQRLKETLNEFKDFINQDPATQKGKTLIKISKRVFFQRKEFKMKTKEMEASQQRNFAKMDEKNSSVKTAQLLKTIPYVYKYNNIICRYILEAFLNEEYQEMPKLNVDSFEDFLQFHYFNDNLMILSTAISQEEFNNFEIVSSTGKIKKRENKIFSNLFPKDFVKEGKEKLISCLKFTESKGKRYDFNFVIKKGEFYENFSYNFEISQNLFHNNLILFGFYSVPPTKTIIFDIDINSKITIVGYSKEMSKVLLIHPTLFNIMTENRKIDAFEIFKDCQVKFDEKDFKIIHIDCKLYYDSCFSKLLTYLERKIKAKKENEMELEELLKKLKHNLAICKGKKTKLSFERLFSIDETHSLFQCSYEGINKEKFQMKASLKMVGNTIISKSSEGLMGGDLDVSYELSKKLNALVSTSSVTNSSVSERTSAGGFRTFKSSPYQQKIIKKEKTKISVLSYLVFFINLILLGLCFVFLFVQISQVNLISKTNTLSFDFKALRHYFYSNFYSLISMTCMDVEEKPDSVCKNNIVDYLDYFQKKIGFDEYPIIDFIWYGLGQKVNKLKMYYSSFKKRLSTGHFKKFKFLLESNITYHSIGENDEGLYQITQSLNFDVATETVINTYFTLINESTDLKELIEIPYYIISVRNNKFNLKAVKNQSWNIYQRGMFQIYVNILNFAKSFNTGDSTTLDFFNEKKNENYLFSGFFMAFFLILNGFIFIINLEVTKFWHKLFQKLITHIIKESSKKKVRDYLTKKITNLIELTQLYKKNPNTLIQEIFTEKKKRTKEIQMETQKKGALETTKKPEEKPAEDQKFLLNFQDSNSFQMNEFTKKYIHPLYHNNIFLFSCYLTIIAIFDIALLLLISNVYLFRNYIKMNYDFETYLYADMVLLHLFHILNTTEDYMARALEKQNDNDGLINLYMRGSISLLSQINEYAILPQFPSEDQYFNLECDKIYDDIHDQIFVNFQKSINNNEDPYKLPKMICEEMQFSKHLNFVYEDYVTILHSAHGRYSVRTIQGMINILEDESFFKAYIHLFFYIRPVKQSFDSLVLTPSINSKFNTYVTFVWCYLILNIILEAFVLLVNRIFISKKAKTIEKYLCLFSQCF